MRYSHRVGNLDEWESKANNEVTTYSDSYANWIIIVTRTNTRKSVLNKDVDGEHAGGKGLQDALRIKKHASPFPASAGYPFGNSSPLGSSSLHTIDILQGLGV